jgi:hypothetical protein
MITVILIVIGFIGGLYVGARFAEWLRECYKAVSGK